MPTFRKKPVEVKACRWDGTYSGALSIQWWVGGAARVTTYGPEPCLYIDTLEGSMEVNPGDWVIEGVAGEHYPCKPEVFEATYDLVDPS